MLQISDAHDLFLMPLILGGGLGGTCVRNGQTCYSHSGAAPDAPCVSCLRYVYQKAYVEFFASPETFAGLEKRLEQRASITYMAVNQAGEVHSNIEPTDVNAVTWGVFPAKEVVQPTVVDPQSFAVWKVGYTHTIIAPAAALQILTDHDKCHTLTKEISALA